MIDHIKLSKSTRKVFHSIHLEQTKNINTKNRMHNLISPNNLKIDEKFFENKICLDIGCGSAASGTINLLNLGAKFVHGCDIDSSFIKPASNSLSEYKKFSGKWDLKIGDAIKLPYESESFDFVLCQGVLHHLHNDKDALKEIYRVLRPKRKAYISLVGNGGLIGNFVMRTMRNEYKENKFFKAYIDNNLNIDSFRKSIEEMQNAIDDDGSKSYKNSIKLLDAISALIDDDLMLTIKDRMYAPVYRQTKEKDFLKKLQDIGFKKQYRISNKPKYNNIRKILEPIYFSYKSSLSRILFGDGGVMNFIITK